MGDRVVEGDAGRHTVFISYSHVDQMVVEDIHAALRRAGFQVWRDNRLHSGGSGWFDQVRDVLREQCAVLVLVLSSSSIGKAGAITRVEPGREPEPRDGDGASAGLRPMHEELHYAKAQGMRIVPVAVDHAFEVALERRSRGEFRGAIFPGLDEEIPVRDCLGLWRKRLPDVREGAVDGAAAGDSPDFELDRGSSPDLTPGRRWSGLVDDVQLAVEPLRMPAPRYWGAYIDPTHGQMVVTADETGRTRATAVADDPVLQDSHAVLVDGARGTRLVAGLGDSCSLHLRDAGRWRRERELPLEPDERVVAATKHPGGGTILVVSGDAGSGVRIWRDQARDGAGRMYRGRRLTEYPIRRGVFLESFEPASTVPLVSGSDLTSEILWLTMTGEARGRGHQAELLAEELGRSWDLAWVDAILWRAQSGDGLCLLGQADYRRTIVSYRRTSGGWVLEREYTGLYGHTDGLGPLVELDGSRAVMLHQSIGAAPFSEIACDRESS